MGNEYVTKNLYLASVLMAFDYEFLRVDDGRYGPKQKVFVFERKEGILDFVRSFWAGDLQTDPHLVFQNQRVLKDALFALDKKE